MLEGVELALDECVSLVCGVVGARGRKRGENQKTNRRTKTEKIPGLASSSVAPARKSAQIISMQ